MTAGKHMEAIRESVEDYGVLGPAAAGGGACPGRPADPLPWREPKRLLKSAAESVLAAPGAEQLHWHQPKDRTLADQARVQVLEALVALQSE